MQCAAKISLFRKVIIVIWNNHSQPKIGCGVELLHDNHLRFSSFA